MATRNKTKLAALNKENCEEHPRSHVAQNSNVPRSQEDYISQVSEEIEGRVTKKLSQEFSRTENRILVALAWLDDCLMNPILQGHYGTTPETSPNVFSINQGRNEDHSQSDPHPEAGLLTSGREDRHDMTTESKERVQVAMTASVTIFWSDQKQQSDLFDTLLVRHSLKDMTKMYRQIALKRNVQNFNCFGRLVATRRLRTN